MPPPRSSTARRGPLGPALFALALAFALAACRRPPEGNAGPAAQNRLEGARVAPPEAEAPEDGQWPMATQNYANARYSRLGEITPENVKALRPAWTYSTGLEQGHEAAPIVVGDTMYVTTPFPNRLVALDLNAGGKVKWVYEPKPSAAARGVACCDLVNRGAAYANGRLFYNTLDAHAVAVDAQTGQEVWKVRLGDVNHGETMTMAPMVVKNRVLVGNSGGEFGVRGWLTALDADTGRVAWRAYSTGPDADVLIGPAFRPFYAQDRGKDLGVASWPPNKWEMGGGTVWGFLSYDPALDLVYHGTANPGPWNAEQRPGDNKWTAGIFARRPETGEAVWHYQMSPHDLYDYDGVNENVIVDLELGGARRKVLVHPDRNGYLYVLDRATGELLSAAPFGHVTTIKGVDLATGRIAYNDEKKPGLGKVVRDVCPAAPGVKDWQPSAFSPKTGWLYLPHQNLCQDEEATEANYIAGTPYVGANVRMKEGLGGHRGWFTAWDVANAKAVWAIKEKFPVWSGALVTATDVAFYGTMDGHFKAVHARTGEPLWQHKVESGIVGQPVTYRGPDGKQYVAIFSGVGGWSGAIVSAGLDPRDQTAGNGWANAMRDLPEHTKKGAGTLYVFSLP
jgi:PQQ-dependent dehydrogenase (methanol/ethanol family)